MHYIIDGYNIINTSDIFISPTLEGRRNKLFEYILNERPHGSQNNRVTIVFDCKNENFCEASGSSKSSFREINIVFSNGRSTADDIIVDMVDEAQNPYEIIVVTNDKGIWHRIGTSGAKHEKTEDFMIRAIKNKNKSQNKIKKEISIDKIKINEELTKLWL